MSFLSYAFFGERCMLCRSLSACKASELDVQQRYESS